jgi:hypothetical protein
VLVIKRIQLEIIIVVGLVGEQLVFRQFGIQLSRPIFLKECTRRICLDKLEECTQFDIRQRNSQLLFSPWESLQF